jgi:dynein heavy chain
LFVFSLIWSIGACVDTPSRKLFSRFLKDIILKETHEKYVQILIPIPKDYDIYDCTFDRNSNQWIHWMSTVPGSVSMFYSLKNLGFTIPPDPDTQFQDILVPITESVRSQYLLELLLHSNKPVLFTGPTGTGKSASIRNILNKLDRQKYTPVFLNLSYHMSANHLQDMIDSKVRIRLDLLMTILAY